jgi:hypothetical protein
MATSKRTFVAPALVLAAGALAFAPASALGAKPRPGVFVGQAGKVAFGVAVDTGGVTAYACDGRRLGTWFSDGPQRKRKFTLRAGARRLRLRSDGAVIRARFAGRRAVLRRATGDAGLFRSDNTEDGGRTLGGWVVQRSGRQVGVVASGTSLTTAPRLSTTTLTAGSLIAAPVIAPGDPQALAIDLDNDGLDVTGTASTRLLGGGLRTVNWTRAGDDDVFVALDADALRARGYTLSESGLVLARGGIRVTRGTTTTTAQDSFHLLRLLDANRDGRFSSADPPFEAGYLFGDRDGDGGMSAAGGDMIAEMAAMNMQFLALQTAVQNENRKYTALSNASFVRHTTAANAIRNLKG